MDKFLIEGGVPLEGTITVSGAKNAALPAMAAALLTDEPIVLRNIPRVRDIGTMRSLLEELGVDSSVTHEEHGNRVEIQARALENPVAPYELVRQMRASVLVLGPLVARFGEVRVSLPGGCAIGARPINLHLRGLEELGVKIEMDHGYVHAHAGRLRGGTFCFDNITVTGTENLMMAAALAEGETLLENAALEPEVEDLANLLNEMGATIEGAGTSKIRIRGVARLHGADHTIIPDRIEAGPTWLPPPSPADIWFSNAPIRINSTPLSKGCRKLESKSPNFHRGNRPLRLGSRSKSRPQALCAPPTLLRVNTRASRRTCRHSTWH